MNIGGDFRLLTYLFLLSEYLSVAPEGVQTNDALHHTATLTHGTSLHILRKLSHSLSIISCSSYIKSSMMWSLNEEILLFFRKSAFKRELLLEKPISLYLPVKYHMIFAISNEELFKVKDIHCKWRPVSTILYTALKLSFSLAKLKYQERVILQENICHSLQHSKRNPLDCVWQLNTWH